MSSPLIDTLALSHGMPLADAPIGATALETQAAVLRNKLIHRRGTE